MSFMFSVGASKDDASTEYLQKGRLPSGQQRHQETKPLHLAITEKLAVLRFSQGDRTGSHVLLPRVLVQTQRRELLRIHIGRD